MGFEGVKELLNYFNLSIQFEIMQEQFKAIIIIGVIIVSTLLLINYKTIIFRSKWRTIMKESDIKNKSKNTYSLKQIKRDDNTYNAVVKIPKGLSYKKLLDDVVPILETNFGAKVEVEKNGQEAKIVIMIQNKITQN